MIRHGRRFEGSELAWLPRLRGRLYDMFSFPAAPDG